MKKIYLTLISFSLITTLAFSQKGGSMTQFWEAGVFIGLGVYQGDISNEQFPIGDASFAIGFSARNYIKDFLAVRGSLTFTRLSDADAEGDKWADRALSFKTSLLELSALAEYEPLGSKRLSRGSKADFFVSPFVYSGFLVALTNPQPLFSEGFRIGDQSPAEQDLRNSSSKPRLGVPFGVGVKLDAKKNWLFQVDGSFRLPFTDYLDGFSLITNPDSNDYYWLIGMSLFFNMN